MPNYTVDFEANPATFDGGHTAVANNAGTPMPICYVGFVGGRVLQALHQRHLGMVVGDGVVLGAAWRYKGERGPLPTADYVDVNTTYMLAVCDPAGTPANPVPTLVAFAAAVQAEDEAP